jgi:hypothetical protein
LEEILMAALPPAYLILLFIGAAAGLISLLQGLLLLGVPLVLAALVVFGLLATPLLLQLLLAVLLRRAGRRLGVEVLLGPDDFVFHPPLQSAHARLASERVLGPLRPFAALVRRLP